MVIEPEEIVRADVRGHRLLYVALTRPTRYLHIVGTDVRLPLPGATTPALVPDLDSVPLVPASRPASEPMAGKDPVWDETTRTIIDSLAADLAGRMQSRLAPPLWGAVLERTRELLESSRMENS